MAEMKATKCKEVSNCLNYIVTLWLSFPPLHIFRNKDKFTLLQLKQQNHSSVIQLLHNLLVYKDICDFKNIRHNSLVFYM